MVGREAELAALRAFVESDAGPRALVLVGEPGIGKTTLWEAGIAAASRRGTRVLSTHASSVEARASFAALIDLLDGIGAGSLSGLPSPQLRALEVALLRAEPAGARPEPGAVAVGFLNALRTLAARGPLLVAVDDVEWLDPASAGVLRFAALRLEGSDVRFLLTRRPGGSAALERALEPGPLRHLEVDALSLGAIRRLLTDRLGAALPRQLVRRLVESTLGNPLFALESARALLERGLPTAGEEIPVPDAVEDLLGTRVARLPAPVGRLLLAVALSADLRTADLEGIAETAALDDAVDAGVVLVADGRVRASHPLVAAAAVARSRSRERRALHLELARLAGDGEVRARHLALATAHPDPELAATVAAAAAAASRRGAAEGAAELAGHALRLTAAAAPERTDRLLTLAEYLMVAGEPRRAVDLLTAEVDRLPPGPARARAHLLLAHESRFVSSVADESWDHLERALAESEGDPTLQATVTARRSRHLAVARVERIPEAEAWALEALPAARAAGPDVEREVLHGLGWARGLRGGPVDDLCERSRALSRHGAPIFRSLEPLAAERRASRGEIDEARTILSRLLALAEERGEAWSCARLRLGLCEVELRAGEWQEAARFLDDWDQSPDRELLTAPAYERCRALLAIGRGRAEEAEGHAVQAVAASRAGGLHWDLLEASRVRGTVALFVHDPARAVELLRGVWEHTQREGVHDPGVFPVAPDLVEALTELGELDDARRVTGRLREVAAEQEHPWGLATANRCEGVVRLAHGYDEQAAETLAEAASRYGELGLRFDRARSLLLLGRAQRRLKKRAAARATLGLAAAAFDESGSEGWSEQARAELERVGARRPGPAGELTAAERRVAGLAAAGRSNKEIARALYISVHTVEAHLSHVYAKLGVRSRAQLSGRLSGTR